VLEITGGNCSERAAKRRDFREKLLGERKVMKHLFRYVHNTCRFKKPYGDLTLPEGDEKSIRM
jgi:hypothetical protein